MMVRILHKGCGGHLFDYEERPRRGTIVQSRLAVLRDGTRPKPETPFELYCERCGKTVRAIRHLEPEGGFATDFH